ncbi:putative chemoreceptor glutamine deamidase CheD [Actinoplanes sp. NBRC 14428]|uniref:Probable chemoreceptor glutamine deamidase CheD n=1 Tax=Pseudosporangium ferrugineum TaxID=439699 RepID=A0A2T0RX25_9ACTN|nr:chemotaxis protein CheD [Pseudosporangium ferrugineum]PRY25745.1 chemotaxis protein CheD [Pseudosporangium ferrugineum]BCJ56208.1 putative chemoreceptor glutamine deamidase CheD [Actinoplanes sp. NBRC 14428]
MPEPADLHLNPGDFRFAAGGTRLHTLLGSCVAITLWHPGRLIGGMCHYLLPSRPGRDRSRHLDGRYADDAVALFHHEVRRHGTHPDEYVVKVFGGADQFPDISGPLGGVAGRNAAVGLELLRYHGFRVSACEVGGRGSRRIVLELATGHVWLRSLQSLDERATA